MSAWWQKSGQSFGIGKSEYSMRSRDVLMCSERYAEDIPLALPKAQLPPTSSESSKQSKGTPCSARTLAPAMPEEPAPMMQTVGSALIKVTGRHLSAARNS